jgi:glycosyltransferase involved in cell wall biosynthesis
VILGLQGQFVRHEKSLNSVYGFDVAVKDLFNNIIINNKTLEEIAIISDENVYQTAILKKWVSSAMQKQRESLNDKINFYSEFGAIENNVFKQIDILHNLSYEVVPLYYYRNRLPQKRVPITNTIHCASYHNVIDTLLLPKFMYDTKPYDSIICTSESLKKVFENYWDMIKERLSWKYQAVINAELRLDVIPLGVDNSAFYPMDKGFCRNKYQIGHNDFVLLWMGRISAYDKADLFPLLHIVKNLKEKNSKNIILVIAGKDNETSPYLPCLMSLCKELGVIDSVCTILNFDSKERNMIYNLADVFVSPIDSIQETFGLTPIEAMCAGVPQIVSDWNGYKDTVINGITGFRIPTYRHPCSDDIIESFMFPSDAEYRSRIQHYMMSQTTIVDNNYFEQAIQRFVDCPSLIDKMSENSIKHSKNFSWNTILGNYNELWEELSDIANTEAALQKTCFCNLHTLNYDELFSSYPTLMLSGDILIEITQQGIKYAEGNSNIPLHYPFERKLLHYKVQSELLNVLHHEHQRHFKLSEIYNLCNEKYSKHVVYRGVMSLIKQGMLKINETEGAL